MTPTAPDGPTGGAAAGTRLGVLLVGVKGAVATTTVAGALAAARGLVEPRGLVTEGPDARDVPLALLGGLCFGGWDIAPGSLVDAARSQAIVPERVLDAIEEPLREVEVFPGVLHGVSPRIREVARATGAAVADGSLADAASRLSAHVASFRAIHDLDRVVVVNVASTEATPAPASAWASLADFQQGLAASDASITPAMVYAYAALRSGCPYVNFTPSVVMEVPALRELARATGVPYAGKDGKTGQTAYKSLLATLFRSRDLRVRGWYSLNILGNRDGAVLSDPEHARTKLAAKRGGLEDALGYSDFAHDVRIDYYAPRGDSKEAWDVIDFEGWLGTRMTMRINWQGEDSALAAPLVVDLARLADLAHRRGEAGALRHLGFYFKSPYEPGALELGEQYADLVRWMRDERPREPVRRVPVGRGVEAAAGVPES